MKNKVKQQLKQGQVIKSYRAMCELLDEKATDGNSKKAQLKEWKRYFNWENKGYKFIITEIYDEPLPKVDGRVNNGGNNTKYDDLFDKIIINSLIDYDGFIEESYSSLLQNIFLFFTDEYAKLLNSGYKRYAKINNMQKGLVMTYQQKIRYVVETALKTSLKRLQNQGIITYENNITVKERNLKQSIADENMTFAIKITEQKVYDEMTKKYKKEIKPFSRIINPKINDEFKREVTEYLGIYSYWNVYSIELIDKNMDFVEEDKDELIRRFVKSVVENVKNKPSSKDKRGKTYKPYSYSKFESDIGKLTRLLWNLPEDYKTEYEIEQEQLEEMRKLFGGSDFYDDSDIEIEVDNANSELDSEEIFINNLNDFYADEYIPF